MSTLPPNPTGWFVVAASADLPPGSVRDQTMFGRSFAVFRTASGKPSVLEATCPHLGAHLGDGTVEGETLRCPFHGFAFDTDGFCRKTAYGRPPRAARALSLPIREKNGVVMVWWDDAGRPPLWEVPEHDASGFNLPKFETHTFVGHPHDTTENSVDIGHFTVVHGFDGVHMTRPPQIDGPHMSVSYRFVHRLGPVAWDTEFTAHCWGLGYSFVEVYVPALRLPLRLYVFALPRADGEIELRLGAAAPDNGTLPGHVLGRVLRAGTRWMLRKDASQDIPIWSRRKRRVPP